MTKGALQFAQNFLLHPVTILGSVILGGVYGWYDQGANTAIENVGQIYLRLLQMCVIPLLFTAVVTSLAKLFSGGVTTSLIMRFVVIVTVGLAGAGSLGLVLGAAGNPGSELQEHARAIIGDVIFRSEASSGPSEGTNLMNLAVGIVPENIFVALSSGNMLAILFFAILFGVALGSIDRTQSSRAINIFESFYDTFIKIFGWMTNVLAIGLFCLAYSQVSSIGIPVLVAMLNLVVLIHVGGFILLIAYFLLIWWRVGGSPWDGMKALKDSVFISFGTSSSFAAIPSALHGLKSGLKRDRNTVDLVMPLGITLNPPGSVFHFAIATMFIANLYGVSLDVGQMLFVILACTLAGLATSGAPGLAALSMMSIILIPLGLPVEVAIILLVAIDPVVDPILTAVNTQANSATTVLVASKEQHIESAAQPVPAAAE